MKLTKFTLINDNRGNTKVVTTNEDMRIQDAEASFLKIHKNGMATISTWRGTKCRTTRYVVRCVEVAK